jgi:subtilisin family serine protease
MAMKRVIAFTMHESEQAAAAAAMPAGEATEGFVLGELDDAAIDRLRAIGVIVQEVETARPEAAPVVPFRGTFAATYTLSPVGTGSTVYRLALTGPLMPSWRASLEGLGVEVLDALDGYRVKVRVPPGSVGAVSKLPFLAGAPEQLGAAAAALPAFRSGPGFLPPVDPTVRPFDVLLLTEAALPSLLAWLQSRQVTIGPARGRKVRLYLAQESPVVEEIRGLVDWVDRIEVYVAPRLHNDLARVRLGIDSSPGSTAAFPLEGDGQVVAIADTGLDAAHPDFAARVVGLIALGRPPSDTSDPNGHGTHVAGSVLGDGAASGGQIRGTAPKARLFFQSLLDPDGGLEGLPFQLGDLFEAAYQAGARVHNNSWGAATASAYRVTSSEVDEFVHRRRDMLIVISAGNDGNAADPGIGARNSARGFVDWRSIGSPATCKNALTVGASRSGRTTGGFAGLHYSDLWPDNFPDAPVASMLVSSDPEGIGAFSSRGPCDDYRIKPDVVAPGTDIISCKSSRAPLRNFWGPDPVNPHYAYMGGTSMAAPLVAGCAALVREYYVKARTHEPSAALLKATLINGTKRLTGLDAVADYPDLPNYHQGFGMVSMPSSVPTPLDASLVLEFFDNWNDPGTHFSMTGRRIRFQIDTGSVGALRLCLVYTDAPGSGVQNNLDLLVDVPGQVRKRYGNEKVPRGFNGPDPTNNVEVLRMDDAPAGTYVIQVTATNILKPPQDFALVVTGRLTSPLRRI